MNNTLTLLLGVKNKESSESVNYKIADYLLRHIGQLNHMTTAFLAKECHVSKSAISRFCRNIGLNDFLDLQLMARMPLTSPKESIYVEKNIAVIEKYIGDIQSHSKNLYFLKTALDELSDIFYKYQHQKITVMGHMQSSLPAFQLQYDFVQLGIHISCSEDIVKQKEILLQSQSDDLIIVFSTSGDFFQHIFTRPIEMNTCQAHIVMITLGSIKKKPDYIDKWISLKGEPQDYLSNLLLMLFANLFVLTYYQKFLAVS